MTLTLSRPSAPTHIVTIALFLLAACSSDPGVLGTLTDAGADTTVRTGPYDECGNGMDDDSDGLIDEGCYCASGESQACFTGDYPHRLVGVCADGTQACDAPVEFGFWSECVGTVLPSDEICDGARDEDCDGAVDEGCPCTAGETVPCGVEFLIAPCTAGTQTCSREGTWSGCDGAVGPSAEVCGPSGSGDGIDNDCDGTPDEGCRCVPLPEVCDDGVDNDCDGVVDEAAGCSPRRDAGISDGGGLDGADGGTDSGAPDGGTATCSSTEICGNGIDDNQNGAVDEGCAPSCECTWAPTGPWVNSGVMSRSDTLRGRAPVAHNPVASEYGIAYGVGDEIRFARVGDDGVLLADTRVVTRAGLRFFDIRDLVWAGDRYVLVWHESRDGRWDVSDFVVVLDAAGVAMTAPQIPTGAVQPMYVSAAHVCGELVLGWSEVAEIQTGITSGYLRRFDTTFAPVGPIVSLPGYVDSVASMGDVLAVTTRNSNSRVSLIRSDVPFSSVAVAGFVQNLSVLSGGGFLSCWSETVIGTRHLPLQCQTLSGAGLPGFPFDLGPEWTYATPPSIAWDGCTHLVSLRTDNSVTGAQSVTVSPVGGSRVELAIPPGFSGATPSGRDMPRLLPASRGRRQFVQARRALSGSGFSLEVWSRPLECR